MTREQAIAARYRIAGQTSLDERAVLRCGGLGVTLTTQPSGEVTWTSDGRCEVWSYDCAALVAKRKRDGLGVEMPSHCAIVYPCSKHQPTKRHTWAWDVPIEALMAQEGNNAWCIDVLRSSLPRTHPEYRP